MSRSLVLPAFVILFGGLACVAQDEKKALQNSVTRLEERLSRVDEQLKVMQQGQSQQQDVQDKALQDRDREIQRLKSLLVEQERRAKDQEAQNARALDDMKKSVAVQRVAAEEQAAAKRKLDEAQAQAQKRTDGERAAMQKEMQALRDAAQRQEQAVAEARNRVQADQRAREEEMRKVRAQAAAAQQDAERAQREIAKARADVERARQEPDRRADERAQLVERLTQERREIQRLREAVQQDFARAQGQGDDNVRRELARTREENEALRNRVEALERQLSRTRNAKDAPSPTAGPRGPMAMPGMAPSAEPPRTDAPKALSIPMPGGGQVVINGEHCEVHIHYGGPAPAGGSAPKIAAPMGALPTPVPPSPAKAPRPPAGPGVHLMLEPEKAKAPTVVRVRAQMEEEEEEEEAEEAEKAEKAEKKAKEKAKQKEPAKKKGPAKETEKRVNEQDELLTDARTPAPIGNYVQVLLGLF